MDEKNRCSVSRFLLYLFVVLFSLNQFVCKAQEIGDGDGGGDIFVDPIVVQKTEAPPASIDDFVFPLLVLTVFFMYFFLKRFKYVEKS